MLAQMDAVTIRVKDFVEESRSVVDCAAAVGLEAARQLRSGAAVIVSVRGVRGVSSSFFNVVLSTVAPALQNDFSEGRFSVDAETDTQALVYQRSLAAFAEKFH